MKKLLALLLVFAVAAGLAGAAAAEAVSAYTSGAYTYTVDADGNAVITKYNGLETTVSIPATLDGRAVTGIGEGAFSFCNTIASVTLPPGVQSLGDWAFFGCAALTSVSLPESVQAIGASAFDGCDAVMLSVAEGSYAKQYAESTGISYQVMAGAPAAAADTDMITVTHADGTVVQMSMENYRLLYMNGDPAVQTAQPAETPSAETIAPTAPDSPFAPTAPDSPFASSVPDVTQAPPETAEAAVPWPAYVLRMYALDPVRREDSDRVMAYLGPSRGYAETDSYKPNGIKRADGLFIEGDFIFVDMYYPSVGTRRTYFYTRVFNNSNTVPVTTLIGYPAVTTDSVEARYGPGSTYDKFPAASVGANTQISVFFAEDGYVFAEYEVNRETVRAWLPAASVAPEESVESVYTTFAPAP